MINNLDIDSVLNLQKKLSSLVKDKDALVQRANDAERQAKELAEKYPERANEIYRDVQTMKDAINKLNDSIKEKQVGLGAAGAIFGFIQELADLEVWVKESLQAIEDAVEPSTLNQNNELQEVHDGLQAEIDSYEPSINRVCKSGKELVESRPDQEVIFSRLTDLATDFETL